MSGIILPSKRCSGSVRSWSGNGPSRAADHPVSSMTRTLISCARGVYACGQDKPMVVAHVF